MEGILQKELKNLGNMVSNISIKVEENLNKAIIAFIENDFEQAKAIKNNDAEIDKLEILIEEECLKILALHQPVAIDLRYIISVLKINNDLERIGDLTSNIAEIVIYLSDKSRHPISDTIPKMTEVVSSMLKESLDAFFNKDLKLAQAVQKKDDEVDDMHSSIFTSIKKSLKNSSDNIDGLMPILSVSRYLERIADHCTNISEDVEYFIQGHITRHHYLNNNK
tara:strand:- start:458 stop:1126 length:669 start_codon:yes stop_codon:yes gene_type:complete